MLGWLVNGGQNGEMEDPREGGGLKPDRQPHLLLIVWKKLWRFSTLNSDKFQVTTFSLSKRFALGRNYIYVEFSNLNGEMMLVERNFEVDIFMNSDKTVKGSCKSIFLLFY